MCRGVIVKHKVTGAILRVPARFVVCGIGIEPNSSIFADKIEMDSRGFILVDSQARTRYGVAEEEDYLGVRHAYSLTRVNLSAMRRG